MTKCNHGDIVLVPFPFTDLTSSKIRPALVISADWFNGSGTNDRVLVAITSQPSKNNKTDITLSSTEWKQSGLLHPSVVKTTRIAGGLTWPYKGLLLAAPQGAAFTSFKPDAPIT